MWHGKGKMRILGGTGISQKGKDKGKSKNQRIEVNFLSSQVGAVRVNVKVNEQMAITNYRAVKRKSE